MPTMSKTNYKKSIKNLSWAKTADIEKIKKSLIKNYVSICSTDTIYGFLSNITEEGLQSLNKLKGRNKPYIILIALNKLSHFTNIIPEIKNIADKFWPGPLTIIVKSKDSLPSYLKPTVALRCPNHPGLLKLLNSFDGLFSTSANRTNNPAPTKYEEIEKELLEKTEYFINSQTPSEQTSSEQISSEQMSSERMSEPSTIIDCTNPKEIKVIRESVYSKKEFE